MTYCPRCLASRPCVVCGISRPSVHCEDVRLWIKSDAVKIPVAKPIIYLFVRMRYAVVSMHLHSGCSIQHLLSLSQVVRTLFVVSPLISTCRITLATTLLLAAYPTNPEPPFPSLQWLSLPLFREQDERLEKKGRKITMH